MAAGESFPGNGYILVQRPACPRCGSTDIHRKRTGPKKHEDLKVDGATYRRMICRFCKWRFVLIIKPHVAGRLPDRHG